MCATVVTAGDGAEALLPGCVPDLKLYALAVQLDRPDFKVHSNGGNVGLGVCVIGKTQQQAGLSDTRVTNEKKFEKVVTEVVQFEER